MAFVFICSDKPGSAELRSRLRADHIRYMIEVRDMTVFGGPLQDDQGETVVGGIFAINFETRAEADEFIAGEPYNKGGLFASVDIRRWLQITPELVENALERELEKELAQQNSAG